MSVQQTPVPAASTEAPPAAPATTAQPRSLLVEWANQQDAWIRALTDEVVSTRAEISDERSAHFYDLLLREKGLKGGEPVEVPMLAVGPEALAAGDAFALKSLSAVENVNALAADQTLAFHPKLTILFGENASGKSGYVRILKRAAGVRTQEPILPNVTDETAAAGDPKARFTYTLGGAEAHLDWSDELGIYPLSRIDVFESRSTRLHVDDDLTYVYTPGELSLFPLVQKSIEKVRTRLESDIGNVRQENPYSAAFERGTAVYQKVESLGPATDLNELAALANVTDAERAELAALIAEIDALRSSTPDAQLKAAEVDRKLLQDADTALATLRAFNTEQYLRTLQAHSDASTKHDDVTRRAFEGLNIPGILADEWKRFVSAGESYIRTHERHETYPREGESCIYCRQDLGPAAVALLQKYRDYCNSQTQAQLVQAQRDLDQHVNRFQIPGLERLAAILAEQVSSASKGGFQSVFEPVLPVLAKASAVLTDVFQRKPVAWENMPAEVSKASEIINGELSRKQDLIVSLKKRLDERQGELKKRESRATELRARVKLVELYPQIERYVKEQKWASSAGIVAGKFQGIFRSLTDTSKLASEELLNQDFGRRFEEESKKLKAPKVRLDFPGRQGVVSRRKAVSNRKPSEILSEGEQKLVGLVDFIAEVRLKNPPAPIVFDDPISSLDYRRIKEVAKRVAELSDERQVVVFTHSILFATELLGLYEDRRTELTYYDIRHDGTHPGVITGGNHPRSDTFSYFKGRINDTIQRAGAATGEAQLSLIEKGYEYLRGACEILVERVFFDEVTLRYQPNVQMTRLKNIKYDRLKEATEAIMAIFEKCCRLIASHSQPMETLSTAPTLHDLKSDWQAVQTALAKYKA